MIDGAARQHVVDLLADAHGIVDGEKIERVLIGHKQQIGIAHDFNSDGLRFCPETPARSFDRA